MDTFILEQNPSPMHDPSPGWNNTVVTIHHCLVSVFLILCELSLEKRFAGPLGGLTTNRQRCFLRPNIQSSCGVPVSDKISFICAILHRTVSPISIILLHSNKSGHVPCVHLACFLSVCHNSGQDLGFSWLWTLEVLSFRLLHQPFFCSPTSEAQVHLSVNILSKLKI